MPTIFLWEVVWNVRDELVLQRLGGLTGFGATVEQGIPMVAYGEPFGTLRGRLRAPAWVPRLPIIAFWGW